MISARTFASMPKLRSSSSSLRPALRSPPDCLDEYDVAEALRVHKLSSGVKHRIVDVEPHHLSVGPNPLAQQPQPADRTAADVEDACSTTFADLVEKAATTRLPHSRLELKPLQLGGLARQQVGLRRHLHSPFETGSDAGTLARRSIHWAQVVSRKDDLRTKTRRPFPALPWHGPGRSRTSARGFEVRRSIH
jgi:hypothetical protein